MTINKVYLRLIIFFCLIPHSPHHLSEPVHLWWPELNCIEEATQSASLINIKLFITQDVAVCVWTPLANSCPWGIGVRVVGRHLAV